jgi:hypothetical protein
MSDKTQVAAMDSGQKNYLSFSHRMPRKQHLLWNLEQMHAFGMVLNIPKAPKSNHKV